MVNSSRNAKIKTVKISFGREMRFSQKFGPAKISRYTVFRVIISSVEQLSIKCFIDIDVICANALEENIVNAV